MSEPFINDAQVVRLQTIARPFFPLSPYRDQSKRYYFHVFLVDEGVHGYQTIALVSQHIAIVNGGAPGREALQDAILHAFAHAYKMKGYRDVKS